MSECGKEKIRKDRIKDKDEKSWRNVGNVQSFILLDSNYRGNANNKVKAKN